MRQDVVRDDQRSRLDLLPGDPEQLLVVVLLGVQEDDVEHVVDQRQLLECVASAQLGPLGEPRLLHVPAPRLDLRGVVLEGEDTPAQVADPRGEPDRGVTARAAELEHLAVGLRRDEREEEAACRRLDLTRALLGRQTALPLGCVLQLEAFEDGAYAVVEHRSETIVDRLHAELTIEIARTPEDVFSYLTDVSNLPDWQAGVKGATLHDGRIEEQRSLLGRELNTKLEIVEQEE